MNPTSIFRTRFGVVAAAAVGFLLGAAGLATARQAEPAEVPSAAAVTLGIETATVDDSPAPPEK